MSVVEEVTANGEELRSCGAVEQRYVKLGVQQRREGRFEQW